MIHYIYNDKKAICQTFRMLRNIFTWESSYFSCVVMVGCFAIGLFLVTFPYEWVVLWVCRVLAWVCLGPG